MSSLFGADKQLSIVVLPVPNIPTSCKCVAASLCDPKGVNTFGEGSIDPRYRLSFPLCYYLWSEIIGRIQRKHCVCDPKPELTFDYHVHSRVDSNTFTMGNPMPGSTLSPSQRLWIRPLDQSFVEMRREKTFVICRICYPIYVEWFLRRDTIWLRSVREQTWYTRQTWTN